MLKLAIAIQYNQQKLGGGGVRWVKYGYDRNSESLDYRRVRGRLLTQLVWMKT
jgi:hypothetical protein